MMRASIYIGLLFFFSTLSQPAFTQSNKEWQPVDYVKAVSDRVIATSALKLRATPRQPQKAFQNPESVNFGRSLPEKKGIAYAYTIIFSDEDRDVPFQIAHQGAIKILVNGKPVYEKNGPGSLKVVEQERSWQMPYRFSAPLKKGNNVVLVKSASETGSDWKFFLQPLLPVPEEGDVKKGREPLVFALSSNLLISQEIAALSNWLIIGTFGNSTTQLDEAFPPEKELIIGKLYPSGNLLITWELPKIELVSDVFGAHPLWGSLYDWNYHTAGLAWAIGSLGEFTGEQKYKDYLNRYCDFMLEIKPYVQYEKYELDRLRSRHARLVNTPLLDFTTAPAMPFIYRLNTDKNFTNHNGYAGLVEKTQQYLTRDQLRLADGTLARETPQKFTLWVDDMFMGIPFMLQSAKLARTVVEKNRYLDDAAQQIIGFHKRLYDSKVNLYHHAWYSEKPDAKLPYWSRANGWGIWAASEVLLYLPKIHALYPKVLKVYQQHIAGVVKSQHPETGFFPQLLDESQSFKETSGTAIFTMAIARGINQGWLDRKQYESFARKGWQALTSVMSKEGKVTDICMGTMCTEDREYYRTRPVVEDDSHGLLGLVFAGIEMQKLEDGKRKTVRPN